MARPTTDRAGAGVQWMSIWKQLVLSVVVLLVAAAAWVNFFPGSRQMLASWGIDWAIAATGASGKPAEQAGSGQGSGQQGGDRY